MARSPVIAPLTTPTAALRIQLNSANKNAFGLSEERCFADFVFCNVIFHLAVVNFLG